MPVLFNSLWVVLFSQRSIFPPFGLTQINKKFFATAKMRSFVAEKSLIAICLVFLPLALFATTLSIQKMSIIGNEYPALNTEEKRDTAERSLGEFPNVGLGSLGQLPKLNLTVPENPFFSMRHGPVVVSNSDIPTQSTILNLISTGRDIDITGQQVGQLLHWIHGGIRGNHRNMAGMVATITVVYQACKLHLLSSGLMAMAISFHHHHATNRILPLPVKLLPPLEQFLRLPPLSNGLTATAI